MQRHRLVAALAVVALAGGACGRDDSARESTAGSSPVPPATGTATDSLAPPQPTEPVVVEETEAPGGSGRPSGSGRPGGSGLPDPTEPLGSGGSADDGSVALGELVVLGRDGLGAVAFGDEPDPVIAALTELLGAPTDDTGWTDPLEISTCAGTEVRRLSFGALSVYFGDESAITEGRRHLFAYSYGSINDLEAAPQGLATPEGIGLGTTVLYLRAAYPDAAIEPGEEGFVESNFYVDDNLSGRLTGAGDDDLVTLVVGGNPCGV